MNIQNVLTFLFEIETKGTTVANIRHRVGIRGPSKVIFRAISQLDGLVQWWSTTATGVCEPDGVVHLGFGGVVTLTFVIEEVHENVLLHLSCPDGPGPWNGSHLKFEIEDGSEQAFVTLTHWSDTASEDDFLYFNTKWPIYLLSLRDLIETGKGRPSPDDIPIYFGDNVRSNTD